MNKTILANMWVKVEIFILGEYKLEEPLRKNVWQFPKNLNIHLPCGTTIQDYVYTNAFVHKKICTELFIVHVMD